MKKILVFVLTLVLMLTAFVPSNTISAVGGVSPGQYSVDGEKNGKKAGSSDGIVQEILALIPDSVKDFMSHPIESTYQAVKNTVSYANDACKNWGEETTCWEKATGFARETWNEASDFLIMQKELYKERVTKWPFVAMLVLAGLGGFVALCNLLSLIVG